MFGVRLPLAEEYVELLAGPAEIRGLIGPREVPRLWERHVLGCAVVTDLIGPDASVCDIGSGAGLPGLVWAMRRPDLAVTLVEPLLRRTTFLAEVVAQLGLSNVEVVRARAEALHGSRLFDVVTSRAVAPMSKLLGWSLPLVRQGGHLLAMKGSSARDEVEAARSQGAFHGAGTPEVLHIEVPGVSFPTTVVRVEAGPPASLGWASNRRSPRRGRSSQRRRNG